MKQKKKKNKLPISDNDLIMLKYEIKKNQGWGTRGIV